ncbi:type II secretory pathway predicted ATPase ExeA [Thiogranum longum]|uniref:Type II secretory pathway predicted ATPase ExeA n=2 Tax=Thiogranum longum TaxID=1537524 RepID=A0A4R1H9N6_9GAMM|nr:type II secretory pathway predicted ATPase ExeA [Thiogranum longum]
MYKRHFGLSVSPFRITPDTRKFFGGGQRAEILETLIYAICNGEGMIKVTGEIGTGKTMLCHMLQEQLPDSVEVVYLANPNLTRDEILTAIVLELELPVPEGCSRLQLMQHLQDYLLYCHRKQRRVVVFIEEAQQMPLQTLEEIRLLSNLETRDAKLLQLLLFGQPELDKLLEKHEIRQLRDRIGHSIHLTPLSSKEVAEYLRFRLHNAGYRGGELFTWSACWLLALSSGGLIRRLHHLAEKSLLSAFSANAVRVRLIDAWRARSDGQHLAKLPRFAGGVVAGTLITALTVFLQNLPAPQAESTQAAAMQRIAETPTPDPVLEAARQRALSIQPSAGLPAVSQRLAASEIWLRNPHGGLTIQLLLSEDDDLANIEKLIEKQPYRNIQSNIFLSRSEIGGRPRWNVLYGNFDSKSKALAAIADLPDELRRHKPFIRSISALYKSQERTEAQTKKESSG